MGAQRDKDKNSTTRPREEQMAFTQPKQQKRKEKKSKKIKVDEVSRPKEKAQCNETLNLEEQIGSSITSRSASHGPGSGPAQACGQTLRLGSSAVA